MPRRPGAVRFRATAALQMGEQAGHARLGIHCVGRKRVKRAVSNSLTACPSLPEWLWVGLLLAREARVGAQLPCGSLHSDSRQVGSWGGTAGIGPPASRRCLAMRRKVGAPEPGVQDDCISPAWGRFRRCRSGHRCSRHSRRRGGPGRQRAAGRPRRSWWCAAGRQEGGTPSDVVRCTLRRLALSTDAQAGLASRNVRGACHRPA